MAKSVLETTTRKGSRRPKRNELNWDKPRAEIELPYKYKPRWYQTELWGAMFADDPVFAEYAPPGRTKPATRGVAVWHRRAGKDKSVANILMCKAMDRVGLYLYMLPTAEQARLAIWKGVGKDGMPFIDHFPRELILSTNQARMEIQLVHPDDPDRNGSLIKLTGSDSYDRKMGINAIGLIMSEYSIGDPRAWDYFRPILAENEGWALFIYTPRGRNHGFTLAEMAKRLARRADSDWYFSCLPNSFTHAIPEKAIQAERDAGMSDELIEQEFECSFESMAPGIYFAKAIGIAYKENRIRDFVPPKRGIPVYTWWDIGVDDENFIWFAQPVDKMVHVIHAYGNSDEGMDHYIEYIRSWLKEHDLQAGKHYGPHDLNVREWGSEGAMTRVDLAKKHHRFKFEVTPLRRLEDQIEAGRSFLRKCVFSESTCAHGVAALSSWGRKYDDKRRAFANKPDHNWASHAASAYMCMAVNWKERFFKSIADQRPTVKQAEIDFDPLEF